MIALSDEAQIVLTVLADRARRGEGLGSVEEIAAATAWPGARTLGVDRTRRILRDLQEAGYARRPPLGRAGSGESPGSDERATLRAMPSQPRRSATVNPNDGTWLCLKCHLELSETAERDGGLDKLGTPPSPAAADTRVTAANRKALATETRERGTTALGNEEPPASVALPRTSFLVPSNSGESDSPSNGFPSNRSGSTAPSNTSAESAEVEALLTAHTEGRGLAPLPVELPSLPQSRSEAMPRVAEFFVLVYGLRLAAGDERPVPFACGWIAQKLGLEKQTAYRLRCQLVEAGVIVKAETMPGRQGSDGQIRRGTDCYLPGVLPADEEADAW